MGGDEIEMYRKKTTDKHEFLGHPLVESVIKHFSWPKMIIFGWWSLDDQIRDMNPSNRKSIAYETEAENKKCPLSQKKGVTN